MLGLLALASISVAQAAVYKCPGKAAGQFVYQQSPCKGAKPDEHTVKITPFDQRKIDQAQENLSKETEALKNKDKLATPAAAPEAGAPATPQPVAPQPVPAPAPVTPPPAPVAPPAP